MANAENICKNDGCSKCNLCGSCYRDDIKTQKCSLCDLVLPISHCKASMCVESPRIYSRCSDMCDVCGDIICSNHPNEVFCVRSSPGGLFSDKFCVKCFESYASCYSMVSTNDVRRYYLNKIEKLEQEVKHLQNMLDYQPGGPGYKRAEGEFNLLTKNI